MRDNRRARTGGLRWFQILTSEDVPDEFHLHYGFVTIYENGEPIYGCMTYELGN